jgi:hypothetical protein
MMFATRDGNAVTIHCIIDETRVMVEALKTAPFESQDKENQARELSWRLEGEASLPPEEEESRDEDS